MSPHVPVLVDLYLKTTRKFKEHFEQAEEEEEDRGGREGGWGRGGAV